VIDADTRGVLKPRNDCFENLMTVGPLRQDSAEMLDFGSAAGSFFLKLQKFFSLTADTSAVQSVHLSLFDVSVTSTSVNDLVKARRMGACPELRNPLELNTSFTVFNRDATIIGSVLSAKLDVIVVASARGDAAASLQSFKLALGDRSWGELSPEMAAKLKVETSRGLVVKGTESRPIAFRPSYVRKSWLGPAASDTVEPFDPTNPFHLETLEREARTWARSDSGIELPK
jgi:hypothetical protein